MDKKTLQRLERGREHYKNREYSKAEPYLLKVAQEETGFADIMNMLGVIYHDRGQVALAQEYFEKSMKVPLPKSSMTGVSCRWPSSTRSFKETSAVKPMTL